jgi:4-hydroxy-tetrahydrodipicolinate reductase
MPINVVGTGKMGQAVIDSLTQSNLLGVVFNSQNQVTVEKLKNSNAETTIDCSIGEAFLNNLPQYLEAKQKVVVVATAWYDHLDEVKTLVEQNQGTLFWADNYSISMMVYKRLIEISCQMLKNNPEFDVYGLELHHTAKKDAPAGTTKQIGQLILDNFLAKKEILYDLPQGQISTETLHIASLRGGTDNIVHDFYFDSPDELIEIKHSAKSRKAFVTGILKAVEFLNHQKLGVFTLKDIF